MSSQNTYETEDQYMAPFFEKQKISIERGEGVYVWDEECLSNGLFVDKRSTRVYESSQRSI
jgi:hypothetical protein